MNEILIYDNAIEPALVDKIYNDSLKSPNWYYARKSISEPNFNKFWGSTLYEESGPKNFTVEYLKEKFEKLSGITSLKIWSGALNGQTSGQPGNWHPDADSENFISLLYYVNNKWNDNKGSTYIRRPSGEIEEIKFVPGRMICFPSVWRHYGDCPESDNLLRITCAIILKKE